MGSLESSGTFAPQPSGTEASDGGGSTGVGDGDDAGDGGKDAEASTSGPSELDTSTGDGDEGDTSDSGNELDPCEPISGASYASLSTDGPTTDHPAPQHADLNLSVRGWSPTGGTLGLVQINGPTDDLAPRLNRMFTDDAAPAFSANYRVNEWDWGSNSVGGPIESWEVTLVGLVTEPGEILEVPGSGYDIGGGMQARVLFADEDSITLKYTREDNVVYGYTIHVENACVEPSLLELYQADDASGRGELPALAANQPFGRARGSEIQVSIRDTGAFMDPRSSKDWWD